MDNKAEFSNYDIKSFVQVFLDNSMECYYNASLVRAKLLSFAIKQYYEKIVLKDIAKIFNDFLYKIFSEGMCDDYPVLMKSVPMMVFDLMSTFKSELIERDQIKWHQDSEMLSEQKYMYKTMFDETVRLLNENKRNFSDLKFESLLKKIDEIVVYCK